MIRQLVTLVSFSIFPGLSGLPQSPDGSGIGVDTIDTLQIRFRLLKVVQFSNQRERLLFVLHLPNKGRPSKENV